MEIAEIREKTDAVRATIARAVVGQSQAVELLLVTLLADGPALIEGMPGTAKTLLARTYVRYGVLLIGKRHSGDVHVEMASEEEAKPTPS